METKHLIFEKLPPLLEGVSSYKPLQGPILKSLYTYQLEELGRRLMLGEPFQITPDTMTITFTESSKEFDMDAVLCGANVEHIIYNSLDYELYSQCIQSDSSRTNQQKPRIIDLDACTNKFPELTLAEKYSINIYTGGAYTYMNMFLRRKPEFYNYPQELIRTTIIDSIMCCSALSKISSTTIKQTFRTENIPSEDKDIHKVPYLQERIDAAAQQSSICLEGFVSTSAGRPAQGGDILYIFTDLKGKDIKELSQCPAENEFLVPPTHITMKSYRERPDNAKVPYNSFKHLFEVSTASDLRLTPSPVYGSLTIHELTSIILYKIEYQLKLNKDLELRKYLNCAHEFLSAILAKDFSEYKKVNKLISNLDYIINNYFNATEYQAKTNILYNQIIPILVQIKTQYLPELTSPLILERQRAHSSRVPSSPLLNVILSSALILVGTFGLMTFGSSLVGLSLGLAISTQVVIGLSSALLIGTGMFFLYETFISKEPNYSVNTSNYIGINNTSNGQDSKSQNQHNLPPLI